MQLQARRPRLVLAKAGTTHLCILKPYRRLGKEVRVQTSGSIINDAIPSVVRSSEVTDSRQLVVIKSSRASTVLRPRATALSS